MKVSIVILVIFFACYVKAKDDKSEVLKGAESDLEKRWHRPHRHPVKFDKNTKVFYHMGCWRDRHHRALPVHLGTFQKKIAVRHCAYLASRRGWLVFSVQYGGQCFSGPTAALTYDKYGLARNCKHGLGGTWANDVYVFPAFFRVGCFQDKHRRALPVYLGHFRGANSVRVCAYLANLRGYKAFSVQYGGQCFTGPNAQNTYDRYGFGGGCNRNGLGGTWRNQVYFFYTTYDVGCHSDTRRRAMPSYLGYNRRTGTIGICATIAHLRGYQAFGVQYGGQCFSGQQAHMTYAKYGTAWNWKCLGHQRCHRGVGGVWANRVYFFYTYNRVNCYRDKPARAMPVYLGAFHHDAIRRCAAVAGARGWAVFAVQYNFQCFSGPTAHLTYSRYGTATNCRNGRGGTWAQDVYKFQGH